jgi:hypothetical protein
MSWVANMMLVVSMDDTDRLEEISRWLQAEAPCREMPDRKGVGSLRNLTDPEDNQWGGWKNPECEVWAGALNHADLPAVVERIAAGPWRVPAAVQLLIMDQEESYFRLWMIRDGQIRQYAPEPPGDDAAW